MVGPSGNPRPDASNVDCTFRSFRRSGKRELLEVEIGQRLAYLGGRVPGDRGAIGVERVDERRDDVPALGEVDLLHLVLDLLAEPRVRGRVRLPGGAPVRRPRPPAGTGCRTGAGSSASR